MADLGYQRVPGTRYCGPRILREIADNLEMHNEMTGEPHGIVQFWYEAQEVGNGEWFVTFIDRERGYEDMYNEPDTNQPT